MHKVLDKKSFPSSDARVFVFMSNKGTSGATSPHPDEVRGGMDAEAAALGLVRVVDELPSLSAAATSAARGQGNKATKRKDTRTDVSSTGAAGSSSQQAKRTRPN